MKLEISKITDEEITTLRDEINNLNKRLGTQKFSIGGTTTIRDFLDLTLVIYSESLMKLTKKLNWLTIALIFMAVAQLVTIIIISLQQG